MINFLLVRMARTMFHISGLQCGDYYFYGAGQDTTLDSLRETGWLEEYLFL